MASTKKKATRAGKKAIGLKNNQYDQTKNKSICGATYSCFWMASSRSCVVATLLV